MKRIISLILLLIVTPNCLALTTEEAYRLIPHRQTTFIQHHSTLPQQESHYLAKLLSLAEQAMVERVNALKNGPKNSNYDTRISKILKQLNILKPPTQLKPTHKKIRSAIELQRDYFKLQGIASAKNQRQQLVQQSHQQLISAYNTLMLLYPNENDHNKQAFFDYLCALDFI